MLMSGGPPPPPPPGPMAPPPPGPKAPAPPPSIPPPGMGKVTFTSVVKQLCRISVVTVHVLCTVSQLTSVNFTLN